MSDNFGDGILQSSVEDLNNAIYQKDLDNVKRSLATAKSNYSRFKENSSFFIVSRLEDTIEEAERFIENNE